MMTRNLSDANAADTEIATSACSERVLVAAQMFKVDGEQRYPVQSLLRLTALSS